MYFGAPLWFWVAAGGVALAAGTASGGLGVGLAVGWLVWAGLAALAMPNLRKRFVTAPLLKLYRSLLPPMSDTEREALEAGSVWFDAELFSGRPDWSTLLKMPVGNLSDEEQAFLDGPTEELCRMIDEWRIVHEFRDVPEEIWEFIREKGFLGMIIPKEFGGLGFSAQAHSAIVSKISTRSGNVGVSIMVPNSLGPAELLLRYGTDDQKNHYLPRLADGRELPCFGLTGPFSGSDAASMPDHGIVCKGTYKGEEVLGIRVTWEKRYITLAPIATVLGLAFRLQDPDGLLGKGSEPGITLALIPSTHPGVKVGRRHLPAGQAFQNGPISGKDVFIPMDWVIGGVDGVGQGWRMLMNCLSEGRGISLPGLSTGVAKFCARITGAYSRVRKQFKVPVGKFEGIEEPLARIAGEAYLLEGGRRATAAAIDTGEKPAVVSGILKYQATERMRRVVNDAMDVHGGRAICDGPSNYLMTGYQAIPVAITVEGANILTRSMIIFGQGAIRCHPWLLKEMQAAQNAASTDSLGAFDEALCGHVRFIATNFGRALVHNLTGARLAGSPIQGPTARWFAELNRTSATFALVADAALLSLGGELKRKEKLSGRFADILGEMYLMSCALKRFEDDGRPAEDLPLVEWVMLSGLYNVQQSLDGILRNFPSRALARVLRLVAFPYGRRRRQPSDRLGHKLASLLLEPSEARDRLTVGIFVSDDPHDLTGCMEYALQRTLEVEPIEAKIYKALKAGQLKPAAGQQLLDAALEQGVVDAAEAERIRQLHAAVRRAIDVDDFAPDQLSPRVQEWPMEAQSAA
jgi:acyl-CoA dehydrogenase